MKTRLEKLQEFLEGTADDETRVWAEAELSDPGSAVRRMLQAVREKEQQCPSEKMSFAAAVADPPETGEGSEAASAEAGEPVTPLPDTKALTPPRGGGRKTLRWSLAVAASLAAGLFLGRGVWDGGGGGGGVVLVARATTATVGGRGEQPQRVVRIDSPLTGFATLVVSLPGGRLECLPPLGGEDYRVTEGERFETPPLPYADAQGVLVVVTETPARMSVQQALAGKAFAADELDAAESLLEKRLPRKGYRSLAFATSSTRAAPE